MNSKWNKLINQFEENNYEPEDIQRMVMFYEIMKETDERLKKMVEDGKNERNN